MSHDNLKRILMKMPNLVTEFIHHYYVPDIISFDIKIPRYTRQMECYNGFIVTSDEDIIKVLFLEIKTIGSMKSLARLTGTSQSSQSSLWFKIGIFWDFIKLNPSYIPTTKIKS
jgi:hypothetical protein